MSFEKQVAAFAAWLAAREAERAQELAQPKGLRSLSDRAERTRDVLQSEHAECRAILEAFQRLAVDPLPDIERSFFLAGVKIQQQRLAEEQAEPHARTRVAVKGLR